MPTAPAKPCNYPLCPELTHGEAYCGKHRASGGYQQFRGVLERGTTKQRGYDNRWKRFRSWFMRRHPVCEASRGCLRPAEEVHHVVKLEDGGERLDELNCQALCAYHHRQLQGAGGRV